MPAMPFDAPHLQIMTCNPGQTMADKLKRHTPEMETKLDLVAADGTNVCIIAWSGENAYKAMLAAGEFQDKQRLWRRIKKDRKFDVELEATRKSFEMSEKEIESAKAVLCVSGNLAEGTTPTACYDATAEIPGSVGQIFLSGTADPKTGAAQREIGIFTCFETMDALESYLESESWATVKAQTSWEEVTVEKYAVATSASALSERNA